jgi:cyclase
MVAACESVFGPIVNMEREDFVETTFFSKHTTRREMLRAGAGLAGAGVFAGLFPASLLAGARRGAGELQQPSTSAERIAQMKAQMAATPLVTTKLRENIYLLSGPGGNMAVLNGADGKILVDSSLSSVAPKIKNAMDGMGGSPLKMLINTHWHFDHTDGNEAMHQTGAVILAHENTRKRLSTPQDNAALGLHFDAAPTDAWPQQTFTDGTRLYFDGEEVTLAHFPAAHTDSDIYVRYEKGNVLHMGDVWFSESYPFFDTSSGGNINGMIAGAAKGIALADADTKIVPGHGPVGDKVALGKSHDMMVTVRDRVQKLKTSGKTLQEAVAAKPTADLDATWAKGMVTGDFMTTLVYATL